MQTNKNFLDPEAVLFRLGLTSGNTVVDLGSGSGFFAINSAKIVGANGLVYAVDILEKALEHVNAEARLKNLRNVKTIRADLEQGEISAIPSGLADLVIAANLIHQLGDGKKLMQEIYRILKTGGKLLVVEWNGAPTPIGPKHVEMLSEEDVKTSAIKSALKFSQSIDAGNYHYGLIFTK